MVPPTGKPVGGTAKNFMTDSIPYNFCPNPWKSVWATDRNGEAVMCQYLPCSRVVTAIWDYCDPDEGMDSYEFDEGCADVCREFICPDCENWNNEFHDCELDESYCIDKMEEFFKTHELYPEKRKGRYRIRKCREKLKEDES